MEKKTKRILIALALILAILFIIAVCFGSQFINPMHINRGSVEYDIIVKLRLPRIISAIIIGMTLGVSGLLIQVSLNNPLADSSILGFQSGATLFAIIIMLIFPTAYNYLPLFSFVGGMLVYLIIYFVSQKFNSSITVIICGIAISAIIRSFINLLTVIFSQNIETTLSWSNGSLNSINQSDMKLMVFYGVILLLISMLLIKQYDLLYFDDLYLINLGINVKILRFSTSIIAIMLASVSVSFVGTISFVGLIAPHIARRLVSNSMHNLLPTTLLIGGVLVLLCDTAQRILIPMYEIPVGITLSLIGGTYLLILVYRSYDVRI